MMRHGKYKGLSFQAIAARDRGYCAWVLRSEPGALSKFHKFLKKNHGGVLEMGKHKGKFFDQLLKHDEDYCNWVKNLHDPGAGFHKLIAWLQKRVYEDSPPDPPDPPEEAQATVKRQKREDTTCKICFDKVIDSVFVPCGHVAACMCCAEKLERCPICNGMCIAFKIYRA